MAIVTNKATSDVPDKSFMTHSRTNAGTPNGALVPAFVGEIVWDTTGKFRWHAIGLTNADWVSTTTLAAAIS